MKLRRWVTRDHMAREPMTRQPAELKGHDGLDVCMNVLQETEIEAD